MVSEVAVSELALGDVGSRVIVVADGNTFDGFLKQMLVSRHQFMGEWSAPNARITAVSASGAELELARLPLDYRVQIERVADE